MPELAPLLWIALAGAVVLVAGWLAVSFSAPGPARDRLVWAATTSMYVGFGAFFAHLFLRAHADGSWAGRLGFGFLLGMFVSGALVSLFRTLRSGASGSSSHATH